MEGRQLRGSGGGSGVGERVGLGRRELDLTSVLKKHIGSSSNWSTAMKISCGGEVVVPSNVITWTSLRVVLIPGKSFTKLMLWSTRS